MDTDALIRKLKIDMITEQPNELLSWFNDLYGNMIKIKARVFNNNGQEHIYFTKDVQDKIIAIFYFDYENGSSLCDYAYYWNILTYKFNLIHSEAQIVTLFLMEHVLKEKVSHVSHTDVTSLYYSPPILKAIDK